MAFGAYNEDFLVETVKGWNEKYPGAFTQQPAVRGLIWYASCYYWPKSTPLSPIGNAELKGIVAGQVYDPATPYIGTQKMRQNFQNMHLLTSRSSMVLQRILRTMKDAKNMSITTSKPASLTLLMDMYAGVKASAKHAHSKPLRLEFVVENDSHLPEQSIRTRILSRHFRTYLSKLNELSHRLLATGQNSLETKNTVNSIISFSQ
mmetsp:Transcript_5265/g.8692  ORF Transcript_5265/g.8692 Transcript_5265/m.8692 type:complete len:205 (+) Transcript_5265:288-902(+)